jgi:subtilisin family serine protease
MQTRVLRLLGLGLLLGFISLAFAQSPSDEKKNPFYASSRPISVYISGVDYVAGEVVVVIPRSVTLTEGKLQQIFDKMKSVPSSKLVEPLSVVKLAATTDIDARVCGGSVIKLSFDPNQPLTDALLKAVQQGLIDVGGLGDFTEAPSDGGTKPSLPVPQKPTPATPVNRARAAKYDHEAKGTVVAVIDSGVTKNVPGVNLAPQINFTNGVPSVVPFDDNFVFNAPKPPTPWLGHGTQVSGIVAGPPTTSPGTGIAQNATVMPLQPCDANRTCKGLDVLAAICYAASKDNEVGKPAEVINLSLGSFIGSRTVENAVLDARDAGSVIVMSAGNSRNPEWGIPVNTLPAGVTMAQVLASRLTLVNDPVYPAAFSKGYKGVLDGLISVGSVVDDESDPGSVQLSDFSTWNKFVDFVVPGENLELYRPDGSYDFDHKGTSFSAPFVAAMAATLKHRYPTLSPWRIEGLLRDRSVPGADVSLDCSGTCGTGLPANSSFTVKKLHVGLF